MNDFYKRFNQFDQQTITRFCLIYPLFPIYSFIDKFMFFHLFFFLSGQAITNSAYNVFPRSTYRINLTRMKFRRMCWRNIRIWLETCWNNGVSVRKHRNNADRKGESFGWNKTFFPPPAILHSPSNVFSH